MGLVIRDFMNESAILSLSYLTALLSCNPKTVDPFFGSYDQKIDSELLYDKKVTASNNDVAIIKGTIYGRDNSNSLSQDFLVDAVISAMDQGTGKIYADLTDTNGRYQLQLPTSFYKLKVEYADYQLLIVRDLVLKSGDIIELNAQLGLSVSGRDSALFEMQADKPIKLTKP